MPRFRRRGAAFPCVRRRCSGPRVWNEGVPDPSPPSGAHALIVGARYALARIASDGLVLWTRALGMDRDPTGGFIAIGGALMQDFRLQIMMATEPSVLLSALRVCPRTQKQRSLQCRLCRIYGHDVSACKLRGAGGRQETAKADDGGRTHSPHPPPRLAGVAPHRRRPIRSLRLPDAIVEKGNGAYAPAALDCGTTDRRHPCFGPAM
ncbi:hypothetical protein TcYC6_0004580 [Trypanosoma cruzi]|nr:hypothetical protein TcYC6_0004580 [Trypanosoma cruzi]